MRWDKQAVDPTEVREVASRHGIDLISATVLLRRGITDAAEIRRVLEADPRLLHNPFAFVEMEEAVDRINEAIDGGEKIFVFGDRDVDGITSTALLVESLAELGARVEWGVPLGDDSYGLRAETIEAVRRSGASLLITVDCGVSSIAEIGAAAEAGIDTIVVDHHLPHGQVPAVYAMLNPRVEDSGYPFEHLSACAVAAKLAWALQLSRKDLYGRPVVLMNVRPLNEAYEVEAVRLVNLLEQERLRESHVPGIASPEASRLAAFASGCELVVYDKEQVGRHLARCFGRPVDLEAATDLAPLVAEQSPELAGRSLLRIKEARPSAAGTAEIDVLRDLFVETAWRSLGLLEELDRRLDLVTLSTLADNMPLRDENRVLVKRGLERLSATRRVGLRELLLQKGLHGARLDAKAVMWQLTPLINASGRMGCPDRAVRLLLAADQAEAVELARSLERLNEQRKGLEERVWEQVLSQARESHRRADGRFVMVADPAVSRGVTGILAARVARHFRAPALVAARLGERIVASLRGNRRVHLKAFLDRFADLFTDYGGHDFAAGFNMPAANLAEFERRFYETALGMEVEEAAEDVVRVDAEIPHRYLTPELFRVAERFEPYGEANPPLVFLTRRLRVVQCEAVGRKGASHARLLLASDQHKWPAIWWEAADRLGKELVPDALLDVVYRLSRNEWRGHQRLQLTILDVRR